MTTTRSSWRMVAGRVELSDGRIISSPLRSLFRFAATCSDVRFEKIAEQMWHRGLITPNEAASYLAAVRHRGRSGVREPARQHPLLLPGGETIHLALTWPEVRLGLEPGSTFCHGGDAKVRSDHRRDRGCDEIGWRILRFDEVERRDLVGCARQVKLIYTNRRGPLNAVSTTTTRG